MSLTEKILTKVKQKMTALELAPYADGRFEVIVGEEKVYSKLATGKFPDEKSVAKAVAAKF